MLNAANEIAVGAFLESRVRLTDISEIIRRALEAHEIRPASSLEAVLAADREARASADVLVDEISRESADAAERPSPAAAF